MSMYLLAETAQHATVQATWVDWILWCTAVPLGYIALNLFILNRGHQVPSLKKAAYLSLFAFGLGIIVCVAIFLQHGTQAGQEFFTGWIVENSLSLDNVFTWGIVIEAFVFWKGYHQRLVMWGVVMAIIIRVIFILFGVGLLSLVWFVTPLMGCFLVYVGYKLLVSDDAPFDLKGSLPYRVMMKIMPMAEDDYGTDWFTRQEGRLKLTSFMMAIVVFGAVDVFFAIDSIPAILAVAHDPFIIISSNMMALIGLQSLYFLYDGIKDAFSKLNEVLAIVMWFIGAKIILGSELFNWIHAHVAGWWPHSYELPTWISLLVILGLLATGIIWSKLSPEKDQGTATMKEELAH